MGRVVRRTKPERTLNQGDTSVELGWKQIHTVGRDAYRKMNALTGPEAAEIVSKVGRPRSMNSGKIALDVDRIRAMRNAGFSWRQIAEYLDVGVSTVRRRLIEAGALRTWRQRMISTRTETDKLPNLPWLPRLNPYK